jgi:nucleoid-associated protein YgaU
MAKSRYSQTSLLRDGSIAEPVHYATWDLPQSYHGFKEVDLLSGVNTKDYVWQFGDRLDKVSSKFYSDDQYWWLIALVNNILYPLSIQPGTTLKIPSDVMPILERLNMV